MKGCFFSVVSYSNSLLRKAIIIFFHFLAFFFSPFYSRKRIWLFLERGYEAQDNAWHLFKYMKAFHPEVDTRFAITKASVDFTTNLNDYKNDVIEYGSLRYFLVLFNSSFLISTHLQTYVYYTSIYSWLSHSPFDIKAKKVFLQHGITHNFHPSFEYPKLDIQLFISGADNEYRLLRTLFKYPKEVVKYTGFARFDNLFSCDKRRQVLIMPTWRAKYANLNKTNFEQTDFFLAYKEVLTDERLLNVLNQNNYEILFYNHFEFQKFNSSFESLCSARVRLVRFGEIKVQDLLKESSLLVTDYSSVYYDFFYMKKPVLFFKLNRVEFESSQYGDDYDNPEDFGIVTQTSEETINHIITFIKLECPFDERFDKYHSKIFNYYDNNNCKRIYDAIINI